MDSTKYIGLDVHQETISVAVLNSEKLVMESVLETNSPMRSEQHGEDNPP